MYRLTVRDSEHNIILIRDVDEPPNKLLFDELACEIQQDCYVDVCRLVLSPHESSGPRSHLGFDEAVEFELVRGDPSLVELESEEAYFDELERLEDDEADE